MRSPASASKLSFYLQLGFCHLLPPLSFPRHRLAPRARTPSKAVLSLLRLLSYQTARGISSYLHTQILSCKLTPLAENKLHFGLPQRILLFTLILETLYYFILISALSTLAENMNLLYM